MNIRENENTLFEQWRLKNSDKSFIIDGCPNPEQYESVTKKIVFVLKDANMAESGDPGKVYDQRNELENHPHPWWDVIAKWCYFIKYPTATWQDGIKAIKSVESLREALSSHCFIQLKKHWGVGSVSNEELDNVVKNDKPEILRQLAIYSPDFIIACGNADQLKRVFDCEQSDRKMTINGVGYWHVNLGIHKSILVDYCHPSIRVGTKVNGIVARGLASSLLEIGEICT